MRWTLDGLEFPRVLGIPLLVQYSALNLSPLLLAWAVSSSSTGELTRKLIFILLLIASVLAHEVAHASAARSLGLRVRRIALTLYGGYAEFWTPPRTRWSEVWIAFAGPAANLAIASATYLAWRTILSDTWAMQTTLSDLFWLNLGLGLFNLAPGLPLDGGHIMRAGLSTIMSRGRASWIAASIGVGLGLAVIAYAMWREELWTLAIGIFVAISAALLLRSMRHE